MQKQNAIVCNGKKLTLEGREYACVIGRHGMTQDKREGDLATPIGKFQLRACYYRPDRITPPPITQLPLIALSPNDGWCDDPKHELYNKPVKLPFDASHEKLWREDHAYDIIVPLGYNDEPIIAGKGSAIFWHLAQPDWRGTEGCVAIERDAMLEILRFCSTNTVMVIES
ncbi:MAG: L,D-transpeptidase family protein [Rickettsiales bacterium]